MLWIPTVSSLLTAAIFDVVVEKVFAFCEAVGLPSASLVSCSDEPENEYAVARRLVAVILGVVFGRSRNNCDDDLVIVLEATLVMIEEVLG